MSRFLKAALGLTVFLGFCGISGYAQSPSWETLKEQAFSLYQARKYAEAIQVTRRALDLARKTYGEEDLKVAESIGNLAALYRLKGEESKAAALFKKARAIRNKRGVTGVPLGIQTEAFFDEVAKRKGEVVRRAGAGAAPAMASSQPLCDLNCDGRCDQEDENIFRSALGQCLKTGTSAAVAQADYDADGCVTEKDARVFHDFMHQFNPSR